MTGEYEVGYGKPPVHTRFRKGRSGNPKGRPKGARNLRTELEEELKEKIVVREGETRKKVSKQRAMIKGLVAKAVQGDAKAATLLANLALKLIDMGVKGERAEELAEDDLAVLEVYERRLRQPGPKPAPPAPGPERPPAGGGPSEDAGS